MKRSTFYLYLVIAGLLLVSVTACKNEMSSEKAIFSLKEGNYWNFHGKYNNKTVFLRMEVLRVLTEGRLTFAVIKGFPTDVMEGEDWEPSVWGLLSVGNMHYYKVTGARTDSIDKWLSNKESIHSELVTDSDLFMESLYHTGQTFGEAGQLTRDDGNYFWSVTEKKACEPSSIRGLKLAGPFDQYTLSYRTIADETMIDVVPGIGIVRYRYLHHGTSEDLDMKLAEAGIK